MSFISFWLLLLVLPGVSAQTGHIQFLPKKINVTEACHFNYTGNGQLPARCCTYDYIGLIRAGGMNGTISATLVELPGTNATRGVDWDFGFSQDTLTWEDGNIEPKSILFLIFNNDIAEDTKVVNLGIQTLPLSANPGGELAETTATILDDNDGGTIVIDPTVVTLEERFGDGECIMWAERQGPVYSGRSELLIDLDICPGFIQPQFRATSGEDFAFITSPSAEERLVVWEDGESGRKCVAASIPFQRAFDLQTMAWPDKNGTFYVVIAPDAAKEPEERICLNATLTSNSTSSLQPASMAPFLIIVDVDQKDALRLNCTRGVNCILDVSETLLKGGSTGFLQDAGTDYRCESTCNFADNVSAAIRFNATGDADNTRINFGYALRDRWPGDKLLCSCSDDGTTTHTATMELHGPSPQNTASCVKSWATCDIPELQGLGFKVGLDHLRVLQSCGSPLNTPHDLAVGSHAVYGADGSYRMESFELMRASRPGMYEMCWCRETAEQNCTEYGDFSVVAGAFVYVGPNMRTQLNSYVLGDWVSFKVTELYGTGLTTKDRARVMRQCGQEDPSDLNITAVYDEMGHLFDFGRLSASDGMLALTYKVCWCQPTPARGHLCDSPAEFRAEIGSVSFLCPLRKVDADRDGTCEVCPLMIQRAGGWEGMQCIVDGGLFLLAFLWCLVTVLLFLACTTSLRCRRRSGFIQGAPRLIEDVSRESDSLLVTVVGYHNLTIFAKKQSIPVTLWDTGHFLLDSQASKTKTFRVRPLGQTTLQLLDADGNPPDFRADTSMGQLRLSVGRALLHSTLGGVKFPLLAQVLLLLIGWGSLCYHLQPLAQEVGAILLASFLVAVGISMVWRFALRTSSSLTRRLHRFSEELKLRNPHPKACTKGPDRAIAVRDVFELYEKFCGFIKDRNMYYIDPNILRRLTAHHKLSYAELVGPQKVQWFVSHWWGTRFQVYCMALQRHAKAVCETADDAIWGATSYWICTFSNNQYQIKEELGTSHKESSFYLALHSGICRGTCMILDEMAMPLKRSWCLFELLQTIGLEQTQVGFKGLLFCTENGVLNFGASTVEMSMQIGERLSTLSLKDAEATTEQDKNMITQLVLQEMESFEKIDTVLREHISDALGICRDRVDDDFRTLFKKLGTLGDDSVTVKRVSRVSKCSEEKDASTSI